MGIWEIVYPIQVPRAKQLSRNILLECTKPSIKLRGLKMIKFTFLPALLFAEVHSRLGDWGAFTIVLIPDTAVFVFICCLSRNSFTIWNYLVIPNLPLRLLKLTFIKGQYYIIETTFTELK